MSGCQGESGGTALRETSSEKDAKADPSTVLESSLAPIRVVKHDVRIDYIVGPPVYMYAGSQNSTQSLQYTELFPVNFRTCLVELEWTPSYPTNDELSLMFHHAGTVADMLAETDGMSPLRMEIKSDVAKPGSKYDLVVFVPSDGRTPLVVDQDVRLFASFFDGPVPEGYTAIGSS